MKKVRVFVILCVVLSIFVFVGAVLAGPPTTPVIDGTIGADWDVDEKVVDDPTADSAWGSNNELDDMWLTYDNSNVYIGVVYTVDNNGMVVYIDTRAAGGETDFNSGSGYGGAWPRNFTFAAANDIDFMLGRWNHDTAFAYTVVDNASTDVTGSATIAQTDSGTNTTVEFLIPRTLMGSPNEICLTAVLVGGDNWNGPDSMPDNAGMDGAGGATALPNTICQVLSTFTAVDLQSSDTAISPVSSALFAGVFALLLVTVAGIRTSKRLR